MNWSSLFDVGVEGIVFQKLIDCDMTKVAIGDLHCDDLNGMYSNIQFIHDSQVIKLYRQIKNILKDDTIDLIRYKYKNSRVPLYLNYNIRLCNIKMDSNGLKEFYAKRNLIFDKIKENNHITEHKLYVNNHNQLYLLDEVSNL